jgi:hypothetical protein
MIVGRCGSCPKFKKESATDFVYSFLLPAYIDFDGEKGDVLPINIYNNLKMVSNTVFNICFQYLLIRRSDNLLPL